MQAIWKTSLYHTVCKIILLVKIGKTDGIGWLTHRLDGGYTRSEIECVRSENVNEKDRHNNALQHTNVSVKKDMESAQTRIHSLTQSRTHPHKMISYQLTTYGIHIYTYIFSLLKREKWNQQDYEKRMISNDPFISL